MHDSKSGGREGVGTSTDSLCSFSSPLLPFKTWCPRNTKEGTLRLTTRCRRSIANRAECVGTPIGKRQNLSGNSKNNNNCPLSLSLPLTLCVPLFFPVFLQVSLPLFSQGFPCPEEWDEQGCVSEMLNRPKSGGACLHVERREDSRGWVHNGRVEHSCWREEGEVGGLNNSIKCLCDAVQCAALKLLQVRSLRTVGFILSLLMMRAFAVVKVRENSSIIVVLLTGCRSDSRKFRPRHPPPGKTAFSLCSSTTKFPDMCVLRCLLKLRLCRHATGPFLRRSQSTFQNFFTEMLLPAWKAKCLFYSPDVKFQGRRTRFHLGEGWWGLPKLRCLHVKHISRATGMQWQSVRRWDGTLGCAVVPLAR